ncbi:hypothetical protein [Cellulomonas sp. ICMP 17802]|uniref:hypothetical protein n=1 Tax=Cellulomonas sp. ICMP 17802 TaxID=3239199 RepID=UPI00351AFED3
MPDRGLAAFVAALVAGLDAGDPAAGSRVRRLAGARGARIGLDDDAVDVRFDHAGRLRVTSAEGADPACWGRTDRETVVDLLGARLEVRDAVLTGRIEVVGTVDDVAAIFAVVEVLLAASVRLPALQRLADELLAGAPAGGSSGPRVAWYPAEIGAEEIALLGRLDLLADEPRGAAG